MSGDCNCPHPDLRPPEPDRVLALGAVELRIVRDWRFGARRLPCGGRVAIYSEDVGHVESAEAVDVSAGQDETRDARLAGVAPGNAEQSCERHARVVIHGRDPHGCALAQQGRSHRTDRKPRTYRREAVANTVRLGRGILPRELAGQCVDLRLAFRRDCRKMRAIPLEEFRSGPAPCPADNFRLLGVNCGIRAVIRRVIWRSIKSIWRRICRRSSCMR